MSTTKSNPSRRPPASSSPLPRATTPRSPAFPRLSSINSRRPASPADPQDNLTASLKLQTEQKEQLLLRLQEKDDLIVNYTTENNNLVSALSGAESRLNELYSEQSRWEMDLNQRIEIAEKLREQVRELEKEKRDLQRRYGEQTATFEAERQAFYDNEQHLKSRIQSLSQARKRVEPATVISDSESENDECDSQTSLNNVDKTTTANDHSGQHEPPEMTSLRLELSTLSTSYSSLQSTLILMQSQLVDLKRVNHELQEDNESYMILLREKTLSGQFDLMKQVGNTAASDEDEISEHDSTDGSSMRSRQRSTLDSVEEEAPESPEVEDALDSDVPSSRNSRQHGSRSQRKRTSQNHRGESLADLPITGPGLDLAAELGRAENKDILADNLIDDRDRNPAGKGKRKRSHDGAKTSHPEVVGVDPSSSDIAALRTEVKSLKDANKALSLYASKIIDRIISQEGFEHVLAVDYDKDRELSTPSTAVPPRSPLGKSLPLEQPKSRPQSVNFSRLPPIPAKNTSKANRRSLSFDWSSFSLFNTDKKTEPPAYTPNLRPLTLRPGVAPVTGARKLDNVEDEEDKKERERLHATMKLMGIQPAASSPTAPVIERTSTDPLPSNPTNNRRFSLFGSRAAANPSSASSTTSTSQSSHSTPFDLTEEALEHAEAESSLAALDAREKDLSAEIARGSSGGFTEITQRTGRRSRRSAGGSSGSTVWSAGMSGNGDE